MMTMMRMSDEDWGWVFPHLRHTDMRMRIWEEEEIRLQVPAVFLLGSAILTHRVRLPRIIRGLRQSATPISPDQDPGCMCACVFWDTDRLQSDHWHRIRTFSSEWVREEAEFLVKHFFHPIFTSFFFSSLSVSFHVQWQVIRSGEGSLTELTFKRLLSGVFAIVTSQLIRPCKLPCASLPCAGVRLLTGMCPFVSL
jgi:hypothetical protein